MKTDIQFKRIEVENFMSIGPRVIFDFSNHSGLNFVTGIDRDKDGIKNGIGKSTLFITALYFSVFGRTPEHCKNSFIPNRAFIGQKIDTSVTVEFSSEGHEYRIHSIIKHNNKHVVYTSLIKDGVDITKPSNVETRKFIQQEILKCSANMFKNSVIITSSEISNFILMKKQQKREYIEETFALSIFGKILKTCRSDFNSVDKEIQALEREVKTLSATLLKLQEQSSRFEDDKKKKCEELVEKLKEMASEYKSLKSSNILNESTSNISKDKLDEVKKMINSLDSTLTKTLSAKKTSENSIHLIQKKIANVIKITDKICEMCSSKIKEECDLRHDESILLEEHEKLIKFDVAISAIKSKTIELKTIETSLLKEVKEEELRRKQTDEANWKLKTLEKDIKTLENQRREEVSKTPPFSEMIEHTSSSCQMAQTRLASMYNKKMMLDVILTAVGEDGAKKYLIKDLVQLLNSLIQKYIQEMGGEFTCVFDENFDVVFLTTSGECTYYNFSMGERQRLNLAIMLAFQDIQSTNIETNVLMVDEVLDQGIDTYGFKAAMNILRRRALEKRQTVFIISHREAALDECVFDNVITVEKKNGMTTVISDFQQKGE